jgi:hypothetical protein
MKKYFTQTIAICCAIVFGAFVTTDALAQGSTCETAVAVTPGAYTADGPSDGVSEDPCLTGAGAFADWYSYTPAENGFITVSSCLGGADTQVQVLEGACGALSCVASADDVCLVSELGSNFAAEIAELPVIGGTTYYIEWDNQWEDLGFDWTLSFSANATPDCEGTPGGAAVPGTPCDDLDPNTIGEVYQEDCSCAGGLVAPTNDVCADAISVECGATASGNTTVATADTTLGTCITPLISAPGVWFSVVADGNGDITASTCDGAAFDTKIGVFSGDCAALVCVTGNDDACGLQSEATFVGVDGETYYIYVTGFGTSAGAFDLTVTCAATVVDCEGELGGPALPGTPCDDLNPDSEGETYQEDCSCSGGIVTPDNDNCTDVNSALQCGATINGTTTGATVTAASDSLNNLCNDFTSGSPEDVWYAFQANGTDNYTITLLPTAESLIDGVLFIYSGGCGSLVEVACQDTGFTAGSGEAIELLAPAAGVYYVRAYNWLTGGADFTIGLECESSCANPFPAVEEASLSTSLSASGVLTSWDPVPGQIGCQFQLRLAGGPILGAQIVGGAGAGSFNIPPSVLQLGTDYEWRVRCGCSQTPLVAGPFTAWQPFSTPGGAALTSMPNPTEGQSNVTFTVIEEGYSTLEVFDMSGRLIDAIFTGVAQPNNEYRFEFDGSSLPNGVYIYRLTTDNEIVNDKFMIAK